MLKSIDLALFYYDNPRVLHNWLYRLANLSDFRTFSDRMYVYICDTGTPKDCIQKSLDEVKLCPEWLQNRIVYLRCETEELRKQVPPEVDARPLCHAKNLIFFDVSTADVIITSIIGQIFSPKYFAGHIAKHITDPKAVVLPRRFDLISEDYHLFHFQKSWADLQTMNIQPSGGWSDISVARHWITEIGGYEEEFITISPDDMDMGSRLTGKLDNGAPSEMLFPNKGQFENLGLNFHQPYTSNFFSLTCNTYPGHTPKESPRRQTGYKRGETIYLSKWGKIYRNENRKSLDYKIIDVSKTYDNQ